MNHTEEYISSGILEQFVLGELSADEAREVLSMAERYPEVHREIELIEDTLLGIAQKMAKTPPPQLFDRIEAEIHGNELVSQIQTYPDKDKNKDVEEDKDEVIEKKSKKIHYWQYGVAATFTLKVAFMAVAASFWMRWQNTESKLNDMQERYNQLSQDSRQLTQTLMTISDPAVQTVVLQGQATNSDHRVLTYWNEDTRELLINTGSLPPNSSDHAYQLWGTVSGNLERLGELNVESNSSLPQIKSFSGPTELTEIFISQETDRGDEEPPSSWYAQGAIQ